MSDLAFLSQRAAQRIRQADGLLVTAHAGMGVDSGLPDFRGPQGFWSVYPALGRARLHFEAIACPQAFGEHPQLARGFYGHRLNLYRSTPPHARYRILQAIGDGLARPNILMFGDWGWLDSRQERQMEGLRAWLSRVRNPVVVEIGAGMAIPTVRRFGAGIGCPLIRINRRDHAVQRPADLGIPLGGLEALPLIAQALDLPEGLLRQSA